MDGKKVPVPFFQPPGPNRKRTGSFFRHAQELFAMDRKKVPVPFFPWPGRTMPSVDEKSHLDTDDLDDIVVVEFACLRSKILTIHARWVAVR